LKPQSVNGINSGPAGGKTTLLAQGVAAHFGHEPFFVKGMDLPAGKVVWVQTDRSEVLLRPTLEALHLHSHPELIIINIVDDLDLHALTRPVKAENETLWIENLRLAIEKRLEGKGVGTLILDLYDDFQTGDTGNGRKMAYHGRCNLQWAIRMDVAIIGVNYSYKQTASNAAKRLQDRSAGNLRGQASLNNKYTIVDAEELATEGGYGLIGIKPGPGEGSPEIIYVVRGSELEGDKIGLFRVYEGLLDDDQPSAREVAMHALNKALPVEFVTKDAVHIGAMLGHSERTTKRYLDELKERGFIGLESRGTWYKVT